MRVHDAGILPGAELSLHWASVESLLRVVDSTYSVAIRLTCGTPASDAASRASTRARAPGWGKRYRVRVTGPKTVSPVLPMYSNSNGRVGIAGRAVAFTGLAVAVCGGRVLGPLRQLHIAGLLGWIFKIKRD